MKPGRLKIKAELEIDQAITHLGNLISGLRSGELVIQREAEHVTPQPGGRAGNRELLARLGKLAGGAARGRHEWTSTGRADCGTG
jgi:hypothetical protein